MIQVRKVILKGKVKRGGGTGSLFVNLPWARKQFRKKLRFDPYPGTLNLQLSSSADTKELRDMTKGVRIDSPKGFHGGRCFKALLLGKVHGAVVVPDVPSYPSDVLEILAPINLREALGLKDGMEVTATVWLE